MSHLKQVRCSLQEYLTPIEDAELAALRLLGQVRSSRDPRLGAAVSLLSSPHFPAQGYRPFSTENEHTGSFSGRFEPRFITHWGNDPSGDPVGHSPEAKTR